MPHRAILATALLAVLAGCGAVSSLNPLGWFGRGERVETLTPLEPAAAVVDNRPLMESLVSLRIEQTPGGAIVWATGLPPTQGWWAGELVSETDGEPVNGVLAYSFRAVPPLGPTRFSTPRSREIVVGRVLSRQDLAGVSAIQVRAARNALAARR